MLIKTPILSLLVCLVMVACKKDDKVTPDTQCESLVYDLGTGNPTGGTATITRTDSRLSMTFKADGLTPNNAYSIWWEIWNKPEACTIPYACDETDYPISDVVEVDVIHAAGMVVGADGKGNFSGTLNENDASKSINDVFGLPKYGLYDARTAEVHLVLRDHGPAIPGEVEDQINFFPGGCSTDNCVDLMFAVFLSKCGL